MSIRTLGLATAIGLALAVPRANAAAVPYAQLSSTQTQAAATTPRVVTLNSTDAAQGIENKNGAITIKEAGTYFVVAAGQIGATAAGGVGTVRLWMRQNGADIANSNTEQSVARSTSVIVCQGVGEFKAGDKLELAFSATAPGLGLVTFRPKGEPVIPSMIFSAFKVDPSSFAQLSSTQTQAASTTPRVVTLNSTDAAQGFDNKNGVVAIKSAGSYFVIAAGQIGATTAGGVGTVRLWMRQNGADIANSNTEQTVARSTSVIVCQGVGEFKGGDKLELAVSASAPGLGLVASKPKGEPVIPSMIFSAFKVTGKNYAQLSSLKTQIATAVGKPIALESTDAAAGVENAGGTVTIKQAGVYFVVAAGQVGGRGNGLVNLWLRQNGKDVDNSSAEQSITNGLTAVLVSQGVMELKAGDKLQLVQSANGTGLGMIASTPKGEPAVPSLILSLLKID